MKPFLLSIGKSADQIIPTVLASLSAGIATPVRDLDILRISDSACELPIQALAGDLNHLHAYFSGESHVPFFSSSFQFSDDTVQLPSLRSLASDPASEALISSLRGGGIPLSYKTDREAVEWAFSTLLSTEDPDILPSWHSWLNRVHDATASDKQARVCILYDLCDPFSAGTAFVLLRRLRSACRHSSLWISLLSFARTGSPAASSEVESMNEAIRTMEQQKLVAVPGSAAAAPADACWLAGLPSSLPVCDDSWRILYVALARTIGRILGNEELPSSGLHTLQLPGILTLQSLGDQAPSFAAFLHSTAWLMSDLLPAFRTYLEHPSALRSLTPNTRGGLYRRLFQAGENSLQIPEELPMLERALKAILTETVSLIRFLPDPLRLPEVSDPLWQQAVDACGRTVTVASEYDVALSESEESGVLDVKPVHRVSLADTEEEKQQKRLEDIASQLREEMEKRSSLFAILGGYRSCLALQDCRRRCVSALAAAEEKNRFLCEQGNEDHLARAAAARRVRLLQAAVARCDQDLQDRKLIQELRSSAPSRSGSSLSPYDSLLLFPDAAKKLSVLITASGEASDQAQKDVRALLPSLFTEGRLSDAKGLLKKLISACAASSELPPFLFLLRSVFSISLEETASLRFLSAGHVPDIPLLPDLYPDASPVSLSELLPLLLDDENASADPVGSARGVLACLLLRQYRRRTSEEASLAVRKLNASDSPVLETYLSARGAEHVFILSLEKDGNALPFALVLPGLFISQARLGAAHRDLLPDFALPWWNEESFTFTDPCPFLFRSDREILTDQLSGIVSTLPTHFECPLRSFLSSFLQDLNQGDEADVLPGDLSLRLQAAYGLRLLPAFASTLVRIPVFYERSLPSDEVASCLLGRETFRSSPCAGPDDIVFCYRGVPFAREDSITLLQRIPLPAEEYILSLLSRECQVLFSSSDDYHDALVRELSLLLERYPDAAPSARKVAMSLLDQASAPVSNEMTELIWPWDPLSPSIMTLLSESLGSSLAEPAAVPFSDRLVLFPARGGEVIGDTLLNDMCRLTPKAAVSVGEETEAPVLQADAVLPPLSPAFAGAICTVPEGRTLLRPGFLAAEYTESSCIRVTMTLYGSFPIRLIRDYAGEEIERCYAHDIPTLAVWPDLPLPADQWRAYYTYASMNESFSLSVLTADGTLSEVTEETDAPENRHVIRTVSHPLCFSFRRGEYSVGSLPNLLPVPDMHSNGPAEVCIDFGSAGTSVILSCQRRPRPLQGPTLVRTLLFNPASSKDLLRREFLPSVPVSALLPTASRIFRNVPGTAPRPFEDGIVLMSSSLQDLLSIPHEHLYTCLKWEEEKGRSVLLCLHQIMLMAALQARSEGISDLSWRFALPDDMAKAGRERLHGLFGSLAHEVNEESGYPIPEKRPLVTFAPESAALGAYFRFCAPEDTRGGFMVLDLGACTADLSLFLRGREQAARTCQVPLGVHYMLLPSLLRNPDVLLQELTTVQDPAFLQDLSVLSTILKSARSDLSSLHRARLALDCFLEERSALLLPALMYHPSTGMPTRLGSILLLHFSFLMMLSGLNLLQISADPGRNDFLPVQMSLCLSGRGSFLLEGLPPQLKTGLWHCLTMFRNPRVASISLLFSAEKKMEIAVGLSALQEVSESLPAASAVPAAISVRPEELLPQFLLKFAREFPASAQVLFADFFTGDFYHPFTPRGESVISSAISQSFTARSALRPFDALSSWMTSLLEMIDTN